jgi:hypothetical protein
LLTKDGELNNKLKMRNSKPHQKDSEREKKKKKKEKKPHLHIMKLLPNLTAIK